MSPWWLVVISLGIIYGGGMLFKFTFDMIDRAQSRRDPRVAGAARSSRLERTD